MQVILLATAWGARHGGINAFNRGLALGLASRLPRGSVACALPDVETSAAEDAARAGVQLIALSDYCDPLDGPDDWADALISASAGQPHPTIVVGHDVITGEVRIPTMPPVYSEMMPPGIPG